MNNTSKSVGGPSSAASSKAPVERAAVERKAQQVFGLELFASDLTWDRMGFETGLMLLVLPLRERVQALARRHRDRPSAFLRACRGLWDRHIREVRKNRQWRPHLARLAWYAQRVYEASGHSPQEESEQPFALPQGLPQRRLSALEQIITAVNPALLGHRMSEGDARKLLSSILTITARPAGRKPHAVYTTAIEILKSGTFPKDPFHHICKKLQPQYGLQDSSKRRESRDRMRSGVGRLLKGLLEKQGVRRIPAGWRARLEALAHAQEETKSHR